MSLQLALPLPYPAGWCEANRFNLDAWPRHITDPKGKRWLVLHVGGSPYAHSRPVRFCCFKQGGEGYHHINDFEACPA